MKGQRKRKRRKKKNSILILLFLIMGVMMIAFGIKLLNEKVISTNRTNKLPPNQLAIKINASVEFEDSSSYGLVKIENKNINIHDMIIEIYDEQTNSLLYKSKKISPGDKIDKIKLNKKLEKGSYKAIAYFNAYDESNNFRGKSGARITIIVNN